MPRCGGCKAMDREYYDLAYYPIWRRKDTNWKDAMAHSRPLPGFA